MIYFICGVVASILLAATCEILRLRKVTRWEKHFNLNFVMMGSNVTMDLIAISAALLFYTVCMVLEADFEDYKGYFRREQTLRIYRYQDLYKSLIKRLKRANQQLQLYLIFQFIYIRLGQVMILLITNRDHSIITVSNVIRLLVSEFLITTSVSPFFFTIFLMSILFFLIINSQTVSLVEIGGFALCLRGAVRVSSKANEVLPAAIEWHNEATCRMNNEPPAANENALGVDYLSSFESRETFSK